MNTTEVLRLLGGEGSIKKGKIPSEIARREDKIRCVICFFTIWNQCSGISAAAVFA